MSQMIQLSYFTNAFFFFTVIYENLGKLNMSLNLFGSKEIITALALGMGKLGVLGFFVET